MSTQLRKRALFSSLPLETMRHKYMRRAASLVFHNKQMHSQFWTFSVTVIKISFLLVQNGVILPICFFWCAIWVHLKSLNGSPVRESN